MRSLLISSLLALGFVGTPLLEATSPSPDIPALQAAAAKGDPVAEQELGRAYQLGQGVPIDFSKALDLYRKSAAQGNAKAMNNLGIMYHRGNGVPSDDKQAHMWFLLAAEKDLAAAELAAGLGCWHGDLGFAHDLKSAKVWLGKAVNHTEEPAIVAPAANALGAIYEEGGIGGKSDYAMAEYWYGKAADLNDAKAEANLGMLYLGNEADKKALVTAYMWFRLAAAGGDPRGIHSVSDIVTEHELTDAQIAEGDKRAEGFRAAHHIAGPLPAPKLILTPDALTLMKAKMAKDAARNAAPAGPVPASAGSGTSH